MRTDKCKHQHLMSLQFSKTKMQTNAAKHGQCSFHGQVFISKQGTLTEDDVDQLLLSPSTQPRWNVASCVDRDELSNQLLRRESIRKSNSRKVSSKSVAIVKHKPLPRVGQAGIGTADNDIRRKAATFSTSVKDSLNKQR
jgi:hypothetical protein